MKLIYVILLLLSVFLNELGIEKWLFHNSDICEFMDFPVEKKSEKEKQETSEDEVEKEFLMDIDPLVSGDNILWSINHLKKLISPPNPIIEIHSPPPD